MAGFPLLDAQPYLLFTVVSLSLLMIAIYIKTNLLLRDPLGHPRALALSDIPNAVLSVAKEYVISFIHI